jgi:hypothetical protein
MQISLAGPWQLSPLTDLSIPQDDITFPAPLSTVLPQSMSQEAVIEQEWHLMHDIEVDEAMLSHSAIDLVISGVGYHAEVRINGEAVFDCDDYFEVSRKDILPYLQLGRNRVEILFLDQEEDWLLDDEDDISQVNQGVDFRFQEKESRIGIWSMPFLELLPTARIGSVEAELINHQVGGSEVIVHLNYTVYRPGLISAQIKFNGMTYRLPLDVRASKTSAVFQLDAPIFISLNAPQSSQYYSLDVQLESCHRMYQVGLIDSTESEMTASLYLQEICSYRS